MLTPEIRKYQERYGCDRRWKLVGAPPPGLDTVVVIPALAESDHLFKTLKSVACNDEASTARTLVVCVINNGGPGRVPVESLRDNENTLRTLERVIGKKTTASDGPDACAVASSSLNVAYINASSPGLELPAKGGVGLARKIGMDRGIELFDDTGESLKLLFCLDADTLVDPDWISMTRRNIEERRLVAAAVEFAHRGGETRDDDDAIRLYETVIRYYRLGLEYARSPYAYHAIGSTIAVSAEGYLAVRGMPRREAGEDFHFLNKLAKTGRVGIVSETRVYPSARRSRRVPFGTGQALCRSWAHGNTIHRTWDPRVFRILGAWNELLAGKASSSEAVTLIEKARAVNPLLVEFLRHEGFEMVWPRLLKNSGSRGVSTKHAVEWFDALKTYKMIRFLTLHAYPPIPVYSALARLWEMKGRKFPFDFPNGGSPPARDIRRAVLEMLRTEKG